MIFASLLLRGMHLFYYYLITCKFIWKLDSCLLLSFPCCGIWVGRWGKGPVMAGMKPSQFPWEGLMMLNRESSQKGGEVTISQSKAARADNFNFCPEMLAFCFWGRLLCLQQCCCCMACSLLLARLLPPPSPYVFLFGSPTLLLAALCLSLLL